MKKKENKQRKSACVRGKGKGNGKGKKKQKKNGPTTNLL